MMAMAALLKNFLSDLKYRFFNDIYSLRVSNSSHSGLRASLMQNHCGHSGVELSRFASLRTDEGAVPKVATFGIAIRACFGKPAFEIMQQGRTPLGVKNEAFPEKTMIFGLFGKKNNNQAIVDRQYQALTSAARMPELYERLNVPGYGHGPLRDAVGR